MVHSSFHFKRDLIQSFDCSLLKTTFSSTQELGSTEVEAVFMILDFRKGKYYGISAANIIWFPTQSPISKRERESKRSSVQGKKFQTQAFYSNNLDIPAGPSLGRMITSSLVTAITKSYVLLYVQIHALKYVYR